MLWVVFNLENSRGTSVSEEPQLRSRRPVLSAAATLFCGKTGESLSRYGGTLLACTLSFRKNSVRKERRVMGVAPESDPSFYYRFIRNLLSK